MPTNLFTAFLISVGAVFLVLSKTSWTDCKNRMPFKLTDPKVTDDLTYEDATPLIYCF